MALLPTMKLIRPKSKSEKSYKNINNSNKSHREKFFIVSQKWKQTRNPFKDHLGLGSKILTFNLKRCLSKEWRHMVRQPN